MSIVGRFKRCLTAAVVVPLLAVSLMSTACGPNAHAAKSAPSGKEDRAVTAFRQLERQFGATLGVYALDTGTGATVTYHADERFAFCSTFKALAAGVLFRRDTSVQLASVITYGASGLQAYSPITSQHVATGMSLEALISAAVQYSDNTAANLLLDQLGGPSGLQRDLRRLGDETTNFDRYEPTLNTATPGDPRDTSTPRALATDLRGFVLGHLLSPTRRQQLTERLFDNATGGPYIRAGLPATWKVGDKTGNGDYGTRNDIAVVWPLRRSPIVIALLSHRGEQDSTSMDALLADATKVIAAELA
jgi:beta-lactamase class A